MIVPAQAYPLALVGCDFRVASSSWRSKLVLSDDEARSIAASLARNQASDGFVDLNTCNRNEWIVSTSEPHWAGALLASLMTERLGLEARAWFSPYIYEGEEAARHLVRVALGQESLVVGERQIAGQLHDALSTARCRNTSSRVLNELGTVVGRVVRLASRRGCVGDSSVGVHSLAVAYLRSRLGARHSRVALVGLGETGRRIQGLLEQDADIELICLNRTVSSGRADHVKPLTELARVLEEADAAVLCTGAPQPILYAADLGARASKQPLLVIDIGIPEQVERAGLPASVSVAGLDELTAFHKQTAQMATPTPAEEVEQLVQGALVELRIYCNQPAFAEILDTVQRNHDRAVEEELPRLIAEQLSCLPDQARARFSRDLSAIILGYTSDVFRTIRDVSEHFGEDPCRDEL